MKAFDYILIDTVLIVGVDGQSGPTHVGHHCMLRSFTQDPHCLTGCSDYVMRFQNSYILLSKLVIIETYSKQFQTSRQPLQS